MTNNFFSILLCTLFLSTANAQIGNVLNEFGGKAYAIKLNRSSAKEEIQELDQNLETLSHYNDDSAHEIYVSGIMHDRFLYTFKNADKLIEIVKTKDPKWKIQKQEALLEGSREKYNSVEKFQNDFEALEMEHQSYDEIFTRKAESFSRVWGLVYYETEKYNRNVFNPRRLLNANGFYTFVTQKDSTGLDWQNFETLKKEANLVKEKYIKELVALEEKTNRAGYSGLKYFDTDGYESLDRNFKDYLNYMRDQDIYDAEPDSYQIVFLLNLSKSDKIILDAWITMYPENNELKSIRSKVASYYEKLATSFKADVAVSDFHNEVLKGIYFSNHPIEFGKETAADFQTEFKSTDAIYMIQYFTRKKDLSVFQSDILPKGSYNKIDLTFFNEELTSTSVIQVELVQDANNLDLFKYHETYRLVSYLENKDTDQIVLDVDGEKVTIDASSGKQLYTKINNAFSTYRKRNLSPPKISSEQVPSGIQQACKEFGFAEKLLKSSAYGKWDYNKSSVGLILSRSISLVLYFKDTDGSCFFRIVGVYQEKIGSGYSRPERLNAGQFYYQLEKTGYDIKHEQSTGDGNFYHNCN